MTPAAADAPERRRVARRALPWALLVVLLVVAQSLLVMLTLRHEETRAQDEAEAVAAEASAALRGELLRTLQSLQSLLWNDPSPAAWRFDAAEMLRARRDVLRIERRDAAMAVTAEIDSPYGTPLFATLPRAQMSAEADAACRAARRTAAPHFSRSYFVPLPGGLGLEVIDVCVPIGGGAAGTDAVMVATLSLAGVLERALGAEALRRHEVTLVEGDGTRLARAGSQRGAGVYRAERIVDLPGTTLQLRADGVEGHPRLIPNLTLALVLGLSAALFALVLLLARDVRRRAQAEAALAEALAFRKAMEDSLSTGLRARDLAGRITYVNPAFCQMVGFSADELRAAATPPYWPPEHAATYAQRQSTRLASLQTVADTREGYETVFMRKNGERFPVMIYEAPLVDGSGRHTGWMSAVLDMSAQRRVEDLSRQQQERLQAAARLATVGEMASLLGHELNQPLAAIASYASGSLNLLEHPDDETPGLLRQALARIAEQAERAGRVIKSVHDFVRRREQAHEPIRADQLLDAVLPLVRLQARKSGTRVDVELPQPVPRVRCDRTMIEQVLLNLTRNGIQAMEHDTPPAQRVLTLRVHAAQGRRVAFSVTDAGPGIAPDVAQRLFTPFFTTRREGMGLGLSLCRTVIEQHGGALDFDTRTAADAGGGTGTTFRFTLPLDTAPARADTPAQTVEE
ncbi:ATP-binding protein [Calidifontimicrobium sp. SYSU G02091]|uniref:ATP-binding protein n=1 Tax=Calidifontimicrobium sp. SYSU G02091 TaxID=2926421 RepID=UPI001F5371D9|nr:ATP-binding protein [Calidifontimicrobium sp. SYSU G02091]MCI1193744.1 ATP-binding protein [Calidifontimicrobium sp. SYSU G02091]